MTDGKLLWKSPNKKWEIYDDSKKSNPYIAQVYVTDGWYNHYAAIDSDGRITTGLYDTYWEYTAPVPKFVENKAFSLLRQMYVEKYRKPKGQKMMPYAYFVMPWANLNEYRGSVPTKDYRPPMRYFRTYESAKKYAKNLWAGYTATQKQYMYITIGRFNKPYESVKEIPKQFGYSHAGEISKSNPVKWLR